MVDVTSDPGVWAKILLLWQGKAVLLHGALKLRLLSYKNLLLRIPLKKISCKFCISLVPEGDVCFYDKCVQSANLCKLIW